MQSLGRNARLLTVALATLMLLGQTALAQDSQPTSQPADATSQPTSQPSGAGIHTPFNHIVSTYVLDNGFRYQALMNNADDLTMLNNYVAALASADPSSMERMDRLAFWINAYNALVVKAVIEHAPINSVMDIDGFFDRLTYVVASESMTLNDIENTRIREPFNDPRTHFAVNCASVGCPPLRNEVYVGSQIDAQMDEQAQAFVRAIIVINEEEREIHVSQLFSWFASDFEVMGGIRGFVARQLGTADAQVVRATRNFMRYDEYDWSINARD